MEVAMLKAVAQKKAHWLFDRTGRREPGLPRRPQEDLVTSAIFGNLDLLDDAAKWAVLPVLLGEKIYNVISPSRGAPIEIDLWPRGLRDGKARVEPDVVLRVGHPDDRRVVVVEVKWHAALSDAQLDKQKQAVTTHYDRVDAMLLLGMAALPAGFEPGCRADARTWQDVTRALTQYPDTGHTIAERWKTLVAGFLSQTEFGQVFTGFNRIDLIPVDQIGSSFHFSTGQ